MSRSGGHANSSETDPAGWSIRLIAVLVGWGLSSLKQNGGDAVQTFGPIVLGVVIVSLVGSVGYGLYQFVRPIARNVRDAVRRPAESTSGAIYDEWLDGPRRWSA